jgi:hypothetical protein
MKLLNKTNVTLLILGTILLSSSFIIKRYTSLSDGVDGFIKGIAIGLLILCLIVLFKQRKQQAQL